jgi:motility quorum-sensing regulator/GCU-specific mRNA interferase toxin
LEKLSPHYGLADVEELIELGRVRATRSAREGAVALGIDFPGMVAVVAKLTMREFYKSMTTHADHTIWQDVYHAEAPGGQRIYLKLTIIDSVLIVSFKEL